MIGWLHSIEADPGVDIPARLGVVILLFEVTRIQAVAFLFGALLLGVWLSPRPFNLAARLSGGGVLLATALVF